MFKALYGVGAFARGGKITDRYSTSNKSVYEYGYRVVDTNFDEIWVGYCDQRINYDQVRAGAIVRAYETKRLNVAFNLALYHRWMEETYEWYGRAGDEVEYNTAHTIGYGEYAPKVREYLARYNNLKAFW